MKNPLKWKNFKPTRINYKRNNLFRSIMSFYENIINKKVTGVIQNYSLNRLIIHFENGSPLPHESFRVVYIIER